MPTAKKRVVLSSGKRKTAIARAVAKPGKGRVKINKIPVEIYSPEIARIKIMEPLMLANNVLKNVDIDVDVKGGGFISQAEAARMVVARALLKWSKSANLRATFIDYGRTLIAGDPRRKESKKFGGPGARARDQKSYR